MKSKPGIKPQDVLILLKLACADDPNWRAVDLARELGISPAEMSLALERARGVGFLDELKRKVVKAPLVEFLLHGLKYVFPAEPGPLCRGIGTSHSALPLSKRIVSSDDDQYVWPDADGDLRGQAIAPLYESAPAAARRDQKLYELLALVDALRVGRARERALAAEEIQERLLGRLLEKK